jgi:hypothetical protein
MTFARLAPRGAALALTFGVAACGGAGPTAPPVVPTAPIETPIEVPTFDLETFTPPSIVIPSFGSDEELEAMVPDTIGGNLVVKSSVTGIGIRNMPGGAVVEGQLGTLGATVDDVSAAFGSAGDAAAPILVIAYRIDGVSADEVLEALVDALQAGSGGEVTQTKVAGRDVQQVVAGDGTTYVYLADDVLFVIGGAVTPTLLQDVVSQLPAA